MNIQYNKHKQEIKDDPVLDWMLNAKDLILKNKNGLLIAVIVIVALISGGMIFNSIQKSTQQKAQEAFGLAMIAYQQNQQDKAVEGFKTVMQQYGSSSSAIFSAYLLGTIYHEQGKYKEAIEAFEKAMKNSKSAEFVNGEALEGIAASYEASGDTQSAIKYLEKGLQDKRISYRHGAIRWKLALLNGSNNQTAAKQLCKEIISDTTATEYHQKAQNLLATFDAKISG